jgi:hypothetical protein
MGKDAVDFSFAELFGSDLAAYAIMVGLEVLCIILMIEFWNGYSAKKSKA